MATNMEAKTDAKVDAKEKSKEAAKPSAKKKGKLLKIALALAVLAGGGGGAAWYMTQEEETAEPGTAAAQEATPIFFTLDPFTVNLQSEAEDQYLQVGLALKVTATGTMDAIKPHTPEIRNRILLLLSDKKASEIASSEGKKQLSVEILNATRQSITSEKTQQEITDVLFTSFVIQ